MSATPTQNEQTPTTTRRDLHQQVTDIIIRQLEQGTVPWLRPWQGDDLPMLSLPQNYCTGHRYRGINIVLLWCATLDHNFPTSDWASFKQYYDTLEREDEKTGEIKRIPFLKSSTVFNRSQLVSYVPEETPAPVLPGKVFERYDRIEQFLANTQAIIVHGGDEAYYHRKEDTIHLPERERFIDTPTCIAEEGYYSTAFHELTHWTGATHRLNREKGKRFGDQHYAHEELVAELSASFLSAEHGIATAEKGNHAAYIANWLEVLKNDKHCVIAAASEASKAVDYLTRLQPVL